MYYASKRVYNSVNSMGSVEYWKFSSKNVRDNVVAAKPGMSECMKPIGKPVKTYSHSVECRSTIRLVESL